eukprot:3033973-Pyramimonas_sp.AAC.1
MDDAATQRRPYSVGYFQWLRSAGMPRAMCLRGLLRVSGRQGQCQTLALLGSSPRHSVSQGPSGA